MNDDDIWDETDDIHNQEWGKMDEGFTNAGYREGITAGKENSLQEGFDEGFAVIGAPLGQEVGRLRGIASACLSLSNTSQVIESSVAMDCKDILRELDNLHFKDLVPSDGQAEEHLMEHLQSQDDPQNIPGLSEMRDEEKHRMAVEALKELKLRSQLWKEVELEAVLCVLKSDRARSKRFRLKWLSQTLAPNKEWRRFEIYSACVQTFRGNQKDQAVLKAIMNFRPATSRYLFPACRSLTWDIFLERMPMDFRPLISPTLECFCLQVYDLKVPFFRRLCETLKATSPNLKHFRLDIAFPSPKTKERCQGLFHDLLDFFGPQLTLVQIPEVFNEGIMRKLYQIPKLSHLIVDFTDISLPDLGVSGGNNGRGGFRALENLTFQGSQALLCDSFLTRFNALSLQQLHWRLQKPLSKVVSFIKTVVEYCPQIQVLDVGDSRMYRGYTGSPHPVVSWRSIQPLLRCKNLRNLSLHCFQVAMDRKELEELLTSRATWTGIKLYTENPLSLRDLLLFSKHCPNLQTLGAHCNVLLDLQPVDPSSGIPFPHLTSLDFAYSTFFSYLAPFVAVFLFKFCEKPPNLKGWDPQFWASVSVALAELYIDRSKRTGVPLSADVKLFLKHVKKKGQL